MYTITQDMAPVKMRSKCNIWRKTLGNIGLDYDNK